MIKSLNAVKSASPTVLLPFFCLLYNTAQYSTKTFGPGFLKGQCYEFLYDQMKVTNADNGTSSFQLQQ